MTDALTLEIRHVNRPCGGLLEPGMRPEDGDSGQWEPGHEVLLDCLAVGAVW
jgi:hypothetical protein